MHLTCPLSSGAGRCRRGCLGSVSPPSVGEIPLSAIATIAPTIENDAIRSTHVGIHHGKSEYSLAVELGVFCQWAGARGVIAPQP
jgi:hypothetical protein